MTLPLPLLNLAINLIVGMVLAMLVGWYYAKFGHALTNRTQLAMQLPVLTMTTALVIALIKTSLALSLGLVGALSIVRFRTAIKEPEELLYLFLAIAIGLGVGADQRAAVLLGVALILAYLSVRALLAPPAEGDSLYLELSLQADSGALLQQVEERLRHHTTLARLRRMDEEEHTLHLTYLVRFPDHQALARLAEELKSTLPVETLSFIQAEPLAE